MSTLEVTLGILLCVQMYVAFRLRQKQIILRHLFMQSSEWYASKIAEMTESASYWISFLAEENAKSRGSLITDEEADGYIPYKISLAVGECEKQKQAFQTCLSRNGIQPLGAEDMDLMLDTRLSGFRP